MLEQMAQQLARPLTTVQAMGGGGPSIPTTPNATAASLINTPGAVSPVTAMGGQAPSLAPAPGAQNTNSVLDMIKQPGIAGALAFGGGGALESLLKQMGAAPAGAAGGGAAPIPPLLAAAPGAAAIGGSGMLERLAGLLGKNNANRQQQAQVSGTRWPNDFKLDKLPGMLKPHIEKPQFQNDLMRLFSKHKIPFGGGG